MTDLYGRQPSHAAPRNYTDTATIILIDNNTAVLDGHSSCGKTVLNKKVKMLCRLLFKKNLRLEIFNFSSDLNREVTGIKTGDATYPAHTGTDIFPGFFNSCSKRCYKTNTCNHNSALHFSGSLRLGIVSDKKYHERK